MTRGKPAPMELLGVFGIFFWVGLAMIALGATLTLRMLARHGAFEPGRILDVVFGEDSPMRRVKNHRLYFRIGVFTTGFGMMTLFAGLSVGDARELRVCVDQCHRRGYAGGRFGPSQTEKDARGGPLRACFCVGPAGSMELKQDPLPLPSGS